MGHPYGMRGNKKSCQQRCTRHVQANQERNILNFKKKKALRVTLSETNMNTERKQRWKNQIALLAKAS